jgi:hypothetical protein
MQTPSSREEENIFTLSADRYFAERERKWTKIARVQTLWNWTFAALFTLMLLTLAFVAKSFRDLNDYERGYIDQKREQDAELAKEYRKNMQDWKEADNGKDKVAGK